MRYISFSKSTLGVNKNQREKREGKNSFQVPARNGSSEVPDSYSRCKAMRATVQEERHENNKGKQSESRSMGTIQGKYCP